MSKMNRMIWMMIGCILLCVVFVMFGFVETDFPRMGYLALWMVGAGVICYGAGII